MTVRTLLDHIRSRGVELRVRGGRLFYRAPVGVLDDLLLAELRKKKREIVARLTTGDQLAKAPIGRWRERRVGNAFWRDLRELSKRSREIEIERFEERTAAGKYRPSRKDTPPPGAVPFGRWLLGQWRRADSVGDLVRAFYLEPDDSGFTHWKERLEAAGAKKPHVDALKRAHGEWRREWSQRHRLQKGGRHDLGTTCPTLMWPASIGLVRKRQAEDFTTNHILRDSTQSQNNVNQINKPDTLRWKYRKE